MSPKGGSFGAVAGGFFAEEAPLFVDDFTGLDGELLDSRVGWALKGAEGAVQFKIYNNSLASYNTGGGAGATVYITEDFADPDEYIEVESVVAIAKTTLYAALRLQDKDNFIGWKIAGAGSRLVKVVATVETALVTFTPGAGDRIRVEAEGTTIRVFQNDVQQGGDQTVTEFQTETNQGVIAGGGFGNNEWITYYEAGILVEPSSGDNWQDAKKAVLAPYGENTNMAELAWLQDNIVGTPKANNLNMAWRQFLAEQGQDASLSLNGMQFNWWGSLGHTGGYPERQEKFWLAGGYP